MIQLMFIKNISRLDTIRFSTSSERDTYFNNMTSVYIDSIYPPHFQNRIQISIEDLSPSTKVNYLSLYYEDKYYYYFIDDINYINEGIYELTITMDTITTFLFDLIINNSILERHTINRWNEDNTINRNYIRENLSNGEYINKDYTETDNPIKLYIFKIRSEFFAEQNVGIDSSVNIISENIKDFKKLKYNDGCYYIILPFINEDFFTELTGEEIYGISIFSKDKYTQEVIRYSNLQYSQLKGIINKLIENPYVVDAYICDNDVSNYFYQYKGIRVDNLTYLDLQFFNGYEEYFNAYAYPIFESSNDNIPSITIPILLEDLYNLSLTKTISNPFNYQRNYEIEKDFNIKYIPQLIDDNYYRIYYGEKLGYTSFPLFDITENKIILKMFFDITTNNRIYCLTNNANDYDYYFTTIINQTRETLPIFSDALNNYYAINKGTLTTGVSLAKQNAIWGFGKSLNHSYRSNNSGAPIYTSNGGLNKSKLLSSTGRILENIGDYKLQLYNIEQNLKIQKENVEFTPDTTKQGNFFTSDLISNSIKEIFRIDEISDLLLVAKKYEQYGYLINEHRINTRLYSDYNTRYYYNVVKFSNLSIELDYINNHTLLENIIERLENGLRLWNIFNLDLDDDKINFYYFNYDNVENKYIEEV